MDREDARQWVGRAMEVIDSEKVGPMIDTISHGSEEARIALGRLLLQTEKMWAEWQNIFENNPQDDAERKLIAQRASAVSDRLTKAILESDEDVLFSEGIEKIIASLEEADRGIFCHFINWYTGASVLLQEKKMTHFVIESLKLFLYLTYTMRDRLLELGVLRAEENGEDSSSPS